MNINIEHGIYNCGDNKEVYFRSLKKYFDRYSSPIELDHLNFEQKYEFFHKMKGISSTLGLENLSKLLKSFFEKKLILNEKDKESFFLILKETLDEIIQLCD